MTVFRVRAYNSEHYATLLVEADGAFEAGTVGKQFVDEMQLAYSPRLDSDVWKRVRRAENFNSWFDADTDFATVIESIEPLGEDVCSNCDCC